jgi:hypothetical protein
LRPRDLVLLPAKLARLTSLWMSNRFGNTAVTQPEGPVVSLTTYGKRTETVYLTIESIAQGELRPSRLILWLDEPEAFNNLPAGLARLKARGLEVKLCKNYGPHKKYYPYVASEESFDKPMVTADDDILYPPFWLKKLAAGFNEYPDTVNCFFARVIALKQDGIALFSQWKLCTTTRPSITHMAIGESGVVYPPALLQKLKEAGTGFEISCPKADDIWLHVNALRAGFKIRQIEPVARRFSGMPRASATSLWRTNGEGGNDRQIATTYTEADFHHLRSQAAVS